MADMYISMPEQAVTTAQYISAQPASGNSVLMNGERVDVIKDVAGFLNPSDSSANEWIEYNVSGAAGNYDLVAHVASAAGGSIDVLVDGARKAIIAIPVTGGLQTWISVGSTISLATPGTHKLRLVFNQEINLKWLSIIRANVAVLPPSTNANLALNRPVFASSKEGDGFAESLAVDGKSNTRWASTWKDPQWIYVDLGTFYNINKVVLNWEAHGKNYEIQTSDNALQWTKVYATTKGNGGTETIDVKAAGRYVRLYISERGTGYGDSLFEFNIYGGLASSAGNLSVTVNKALNKTAVASSYEGEVWNASRAVDGDSATRWSSSFSDPQWIYVDLGVVQPINRVLLNWEWAYGKAYQIQVSDDKINWTTIHTTTAGDGGIDNILLSATGRYVRLYGMERATAYGYSLWDFEVY